MWNPAQLTEIKALLDACIDDADREVVDAIRRNDGRTGSREALLSQLDVLEKVRERLHVRYDHANGIAKWHDYPAATSGTNHT